MSHYQHNEKWLLWLAPFRDLSVSVAYIIPFFIEKGLSLTQIMLLQSVFSAAFLLWELPSGYLADRYGRARCIKWSGPIAALALLSYGFSHTFWQLALGEIALAIAKGLVSGVDTALLNDSLRADGREDEYVKLSQRMDALNFASTAAGVPIAMLLVHFVGVSSTMVADGLLAAIGTLFALKLVDVPHIMVAPDGEQLTLFQSVRQLGRVAEVRWLIILMTALSTATYLGFWLTTPYYTAIGIPLVLFGLVLGVRNIWKAWLSHHFVSKTHLERNMVFHAVTAGLVFVAMASRQIWLVWIVLGHDVVHALHRQPLMALLNDHIAPTYRATLNSLVNVVQRLVVLIAGPLAAILIEKSGMTLGFSVIGAACSMMALIAIVRLRKSGTLTA